MNIDTIKKRKILLIERNGELRGELYRILSPIYQVYECSFIRQGLEQLEEKNEFNLVLTNTNLHAQDHSLMDGFSIARMCQFIKLPVPVILYSDDLHPLVRMEANNFGVFKILDLSDPDFYKHLFETIHFALKISNWQIKFEAKKNNLQKVTEFLGNISRVSPIQWNYADEKLFNSFFWSETNDLYGYANSWAYICQAARNNGHKFFDGSCLITIATEDIQDPNNIKFLLINPIGKASVKKTIQLAEKLRDFSGNAVAIKKISSTQIKYFLETNKFKILEKPISNRLIDQYDDVHPQAVVNLKAFLKHLTSKELSSFRFNLNKFSKRNYEMKILAPERFDDLWDIMMKWKRSFIQRYEDHGEFTEIPRDDDYYITPYFPIFAYYSKYVDNKTTLSSLTYVDNIPVGFSFLSRVSKICMAMYANIADTDYFGLAEFMLYQNLTKAYWSGYQYVNLGGTESKYLYKFYKRFELNLKDAESFEIKSNYLIYS